MKKKTKKIAALLLVGIVCTICVAIIAAGSIILHVEGREFLENYLCIVLGTVISVSALLRAKALLKESSTLNTVEKKAPEEEWELFDEDVSF